MPSDHPEWIITASELKPLLDKVTLLDVREADELAESRIEGCKHIPLGEITSRVEREIGKDEDIVIYCAHGVRSMRALMAMARMGYCKLRSLEGGICAWQEQGAARG